MKATNNSNQQQQQRQQQQPPGTTTPIFPQKSHLTVTDVSFSSYLRPPEEQNRASFQDQNRNTANDTELGIFDARKYFNEGVAVSNIDQTLSSSKRVSPIKESPNLNHPSDPSFFPRFSSASSIEGYGKSYRTRSLASSEASWNSHTGLLGPSSERDKNRGGSRKDKVPRWLLLRSKCPCSGKKSVQVKENRKEAATSREKSMMAEDQKKHFRVSSNTNMEGRHVLVSAPLKPLIDTSSVTVTATPGFTFPILTATNPSPSPPSSSSPMKTPISIPEVPKDIGEGKNTNAAASTVDVTDHGDEVASDASSDLFEIESISTQCIYPIPSNLGDKKLVGIHQSEAAPCVRIVTVVPEGAKFGPKMADNNYSSLLSAPEFEMFPRIDLGRSARGIGGADCDSDRPRGNGLLSCRT